MRRAHWATAIVAVVLAGVGVAACTDDDDTSESRDGATVGDHYHAQLAVFVCGADIGPAPAFEQRADQPDIRAGVHTHGDGYIHIHPFTSDEAGDNATVGRFLLSAGYALSDDGMELWDEAAHVDGDTCPDGRTGEVRWSVNGEEQDGDPTSYRPEDGDVIVIAFVAEDDDIPAAPDVVPTQD